MKKTVIVDGKELKRLPKSFAELEDILNTVSRNAARSAEDHTLFILGRPSRRYGNSMVAQASSTTTEEPINGRPDVVKALAEIGLANAKIAYSLMSALKGSK